MTFSLLGRCRETGQLGAVVTTSDLAVGARVPHARAGLGVAVTQNRTDPRLGPALLDALAQGGGGSGDGGEAGGADGAGAALGRVLERTPHPDWRQLGVLDAGGGWAAHTGTHAWPYAGALAGEDCLAVGNMLLAETVLSAMTTAFTQASGELASRLTVAIAAGLGAGGETGALRSAALLVVESESFPLVDLRVDDASDPLGDLAALWAAYAPHARDFVARALDPDHAHGSSSTNT